MSMLCHVGKGSLATLRSQYDRRLESVSLIVLAVLDYCVHANLSFGWNDNCT